MKALLYSTILIFLIACETASPEDPQQIIDRSIKSHGFDRLTGKEIEFTFRKKKYTVTRADRQYVYSRDFEDSSGSVHDELLNSSELKRTVNGQPVVLSKKAYAGAAESINSVFYFFQLPFGLNDSAVNKKFAGTEELDGKSYYLVKITFGEEGGGKDFQDEYLYWIDQQTFKVDFLAYNYIVNGGGVRFRKAINRRTIDGMTFQDYINYKPSDKTTPLRSLGKLYESQQLEELSRILSEDIKVQS